MGDKIFLGSPELGRVLADLRMTCLDIGARRGFIEDLLPLASAVDARGFEPDQAECERLNQAAVEESHPWRTLKFIPIALGREYETRTLHLYRQRGCSSLFKADVDLAAAFSREDYYELEGIVELSTMPLDDAIATYELTNIAFMKIDIQGAELEVFLSAPKLLREQLLAIRTEVSFLPIYYNQPLYSDIDAHLRNYGFLPMGFIELHHWRRSTKRKHPNLIKGDIPYSQGQIIHGDMLFFRDPRLMADDSPQAIEKLLKMAFIALAYGYVDHAATILSRPTLTQHLQSRYNRINITKSLRQVSQTLLSQHRRTELFQSMKWIVKRLIGRR